MCISMVAQRGRNRQAQYVTALLTYTHSYIFIATRGEDDVMRIFRSRPASVKLEISDARDFYIDGDTICGEVVLVLKARSNVRSLYVDLMGIENVCLSPQDEARRNEFYWCREKLLEGETLDQGRHVYGYAVSVPTSSGHYPPSFKAAELGNCGIRWYIIAEAASDGRGQGQTSTVEDKTEIRVLQRMPEYYTLRPDKRNFSQLFGEGVRCWISSPVWMPQAPDVVDAVVVVELDDPALVGSVEVYIQGQVVVWWELDSKVIVWKHALETVRFDAVVSRVELDGKLRKWQLKGRLPSPFSSANLHFFYTLCAAVQVAGRSTTFEQVNVEVVTPGAQYRSDMEAPPAYAADRHEDGPGSGQP